MWPDWLERKAEDAGRLEAQRRDVARDARGSCSNLIALPLLTRRGRLDV
jgi:hypothetical protein